MLRTADTLNRPLERVSGNSAPIHALPSELVAEVFKDGYDPLDPERLDTQYLLSISSVCTSWRHISLNTPTLWTNIRFDDPARLSQRAVARLCRRLEAYLERSKDASLDISLDFLVSRQSIAVPVLERFTTDVIFPHLHHCRALSISLSEIRQLAKFFPLKGQLKRLKTLDIQCFPDRRKPLPVDLLPARLFEDGGTSSLETFRSCGTYDTKYMISSIPLSTLRRIDISTGICEWTGILKVLARCTNVEGALLDLDPSVQWQSDANDQQEPFALFRLKKLEVKRPWLPKLSMFLSTPALEELTLFSRGRASSLDSSSPELQTIPTLPLSENLHVIKLDGLFLLTPNLIPIFDPHPYIRILRLNSCSQYCAVLALLLGIAEEPFTCWTAYVPNKPSVLISLELLEIQQTLGWGGGSSMMGAALIRVLDMRPDLHVAMDLWSFGKANVAEFEEMKATYGERFVELRGTPSIMEI